MNIRDIILESRGADNLGIQDTEKYIDLVLSGIVWYPWEENIEIHHAFIRPCGEAIGYKYPHKGNIHFILASLLMVGFDECKNPLWELDKEGAIKVKERTCCKLPGTLPITDFQEDILKKVLKNRSGGTGIIFLGSDNYYGFRKPFTYMEISQMDKYMLYKHLTEL